MLVAMNERFTALMASRASLEDDFCGAWHEQESRRVEFDQ